MHPGLKVARKAHELASGTVFRYEAMAAWAGVTLKQASNTLADLSRVEKSYHRAVERVSRGTYRIL